MDNNVDKDKRVLEGQDLGLDTTLVVPMMEEDLNQDLNLIVQRSDESIIDFAKRAILSAQNSKNESIFKFADGIEVSSKDVDLEDKFAPNILAVTYEIAKSTEAKKTEKQGSIKEQEIIDTAENDTKIELDTEIINPLQFLLNATTEKYHSEEQRQQIEQLQGQKKQLLANKEELVKKIVMERDIDMKNSHVEKKQAQEIKAAKLERLAKSITLQEEEIASLEKEIEEQQNSATYKKEKEELAKLAEQIEKQSTSTGSKGLMYAYVAKRQLLEKSVAQHEEYIRYIESKAMEHHEKIESLQLEMKEVSDQYREQVKNILANITSKYGEAENQNGKMVSNFENIPDIIVMNQSIQNVENELTRLQRNPEEIYAHITELMQNGADVELVREELGLLAATISNPLISGVLEKDKETYQVSTDQIYSLEQQLEELEKKYNTDPYFKQKEMIQDREEILLLKKGIQRNEAQIKLLEKELQRYEDQKQLPNLKAQLERLQNSIRSNEELVDYLVAGSEEKQATEDLIERLKVQEKNVIKNIRGLQKDGKVANPQQIQKNLEYEKQSIRTQNAKITELQEKDYTDTEAKKRDANKIQKLKQRIQELTEQTKYLGMHTVESLQESILEDYTKTLENQGLTISEEEIEEIYEEPSKGLLAKIKQINFKKKAMEALSNMVIALAVATHIMPTIAASQITEIDPKDVMPTTTTQSEQPAEENITVDNSLNADEVSNLESMLVSALEDYVTEPIQDKIVSTREVAPMENTTIPQESYEPGKFYAIVGNAPIAVNLMEAQNYIDQGYEVVSTYQEEDGQLGFLHLGETTESKTR